MDCLKKELIVPRLVVVSSATLASTPVKARLASVCSWRLIEGVGTTMIARFAYNTINLNLTESTFALVKSENRLAV